MIFETSLRSSWSIKVSIAAQKFATSVLRTVRVVIQPETPGWFKVWLKGEYVSKVGLRLLLKEPDDLFTWDQIYWSNPERKPQSVLFA